jgi:hypothetical protein
VDHVGPFADGRGSVASSIIMRARLGRAWRGQPYLLTPS